LGERFTHNSGVLRRGSVELRSKLTYEN